MEPQIKEFVSSLLKTQITDNLTLSDKEKKLNHQTGLICFLQGYCLEIGFQIQPNINQAISHYLYGIKYFADPLCAHQLEQYYTKNKNKILASLQIQTFNNDFIIQKRIYTIYKRIFKSTELIVMKFQLQCLYFLLIELVYEIKPQHKKVEIEKYNEALQELAPTPDIPLNQLSNFLQSLYLFRENESQQHYDSLLLNYEQMGAKIHAYPILIKQFTLQTKNPDKSPDTEGELDIPSFSQGICNKSIIILYIQNIDKIIKDIQKLIRKTIIYSAIQFISKVNQQIQSLFQIRQCLYNISLYGMIDGSHLNSIRQIVFELSFLHRPQPYGEVIEQLYTRGTQYVIHKILIFQKRAKVLKDHELQEEEIKFVDSQNSLISLYILGKRQTDKTKNCLLCRAKELLKNPWPESPFIMFVYMFYQAKLELHHQNHDGYQKLLDQNLFEECKQYYDRNVLNFKQVRTLQFYSIRRRLDKQRDKITFKNKQIQTIFDQKRVQQLDHSRGNFQALQLSQIELRRSFVNQSPEKKIIDAIKQTQSIYVNSGNKRINFDRTIQGPQILPQLEEKQLQKSRFIDLENKIRYTKLNLIQSEDISEIQFTVYYIKNKSNRDGQLNLGKYQGQVISIKTLAYMNYDQINQYFKFMKKFSNLEHQNIRTIIGYNIDDLQEQDLSGQIRIITYKYDYNLRTFLQRNKISTKEKWHIAVQIIDAIYYLHQHEVIFCNLHPNNILIDGDTHVPVLIDFDLQFDKEYLDIKYMAKQVIEEEMPLFTEKTDIYSIGCILLYLFFGCEFHFLQIHHSTTLTLEAFQNLNPHQSTNVEFLVPPGSEALQERARVITLKCLNGEIELLDLLQHFYDYV